MCARTPLLLVVVFAACATAPKPSPRQTSCEIDVELVTSEYTGRASDPADARKTLAQAREAACAALHAESPDTDCDDPHQVIESTRTQTSSTHGVVTQTAEVSLRRVVNLLHHRAEGVARDPLELCRSATAALCASPPAGLSCFKRGVECTPIDDRSTRCAPGERARVRPLFGPR